MIAQNALFTAEVPEHGVIDGHVRFRLAKTDKESVAVVGLCANLVAGLMFEKLHAQGTNIVLSLAEDTGRIDVVARNADDGLNLLWTPGETEQGKLDDAQARIADRLAALSAPAKAAPPPAPEPSEADDEYLVKQLRRIP